MVNHFYLLPVPNTIRKQIGPDSLMKCGAYNLASIQNHGLQFKVSGRYRLVEYEGYGIYSDQLAEIIGREADRA